MEAPYFGLDDGGPAASMGKSRVGRSWRFRESPADRARMTERPRSMKKDDGLFFRNACEVQG